LLPQAYALYQNQPNPFANSTNIRFDLPVACDVHLELYDIQGRRVRTLAEGTFRPGRQSVTWDMRDGGGGWVRPGIYLYRLQAGSFRAQKKMVLLP
jgi:hypothetical protein